MDDTQRLLRDVFRTDNIWTIPVSVTGSAAMEAAFANLVEPGGAVLAPSNGYFGDRIAEMARPAGGMGERVDAPWGEPLAPRCTGLLCRPRPRCRRRRPRRDLDRRPPAVDGRHRRRRPRPRRALVADCVTSLGGVEFRTDGWGVDVAYSTAQKCPSRPTGASPLTVGEAAVAKITDREAPVRSRYLDLTEPDAYWGSDRSYHHTAPVNNVYALRDALRLVQAEGLDERGAPRAVRGGAPGGAVVARPRTGRRRRRPAPEPHDGAAPGRTRAGTRRRPRAGGPRRRKIATGLGAFADEAVRVGCLGHCARRGPVLETFGDRGETLVDCGVDVDPAAGVAAAVASLSGE
jgi:alanine-glyoxylate transaminase/serine-glyoxylate transaminase/serine-pyruvate transaminase